jgi:HlyD family secretion protein
MEKNKFISKKVLISGLIATTIVIVGYSISLKSNSKEISSAPMVRAMPLKKNSIMETISVSGAIYSANTKNIYSTQSYPVKEVFVKIGDSVKAGDVLATLDMSNVNYELRQSENNIRSAQLSSLEENNSRLSSIVNAETSLESAKLSLEKQQLNYENIKSQYDNSTSAELVNSQTAISNALTNLNNAKNDLEIKTKDYNTNKTLLESGSISKSQFELSEQALEIATSTLSTNETAYNNAMDNDERVKLSLYQALINAEKDLQSSNINYKSAENSLKQAKAKDTTSSITVENQKISLEKLQQQLGEDKIIATLDGVITELNAVVGAVSSEKILFVIEDTNDLYVSAKVKEYSLADISIPQGAFVTTDSVNKELLKSEISFISPKAVSEAGSTTVEFEVHASILDKNPLLKIGMNAFMDIIIASKDDVFSVPYSVLTTNTNNESVIYILNDNTVAEILVETGLETSTSVEIYSEHLYDGLVVIYNPNDVTVGETIDQSLIQSGIRTRPAVNSEAGSPQIDINERPRDDRPTGNRPTGYANPAGNSFEPATNLGR